MRRSSTLRAGKALSRPAAEEAETPEYASFLDYLGRSGINFSTCYFRSDTYSKVPERDLAMVADLMDYDFDISLVESGRVKGSSESLFRYNGRYQDVELEIIKIGMLNGNPRVPAQILFKRRSKIKGLVAGTRSKLVR